jgi:hypothetical protein
MAYRRPFPEGPASEQPGLQAAGPHGAGILVSSFQFAWAVGERENPVPFHPTSRVKMMIPTAKVSVAGIRRDSSGEFFPLATVHSGDSVGDFRSSADSAAASSPAPSLVSEEEGAWSDRRRICIVLLYSLPM